MANTRLATYDPRTCPGQEESFSFLSCLVFFCDPLYGEHRHFGVYAEMAGKVVLALVVAAFVGTHAFMPSAMQLKIPLGKSHETCELVC